MTINRLTPEKWQAAREVFQAPREPGNVVVVNLTPDAKPELPENASDSDKAKRLLCDFIELARGISESLKGV